jgi:SAM-dependent methyltransferase
LSSKQETDVWLERVYGAGDRAALEKHYDQWADTYDADLQQVGYLHLPVITGLLGRHVPRKDAAILDAGVGTGQVGAVLNLLGYNNLSGIDMSEAMLAVADRRQCYADLRRGILGEPLSYLDNSFDAIISIGTFTLGHAPPQAFEELSRILEPGGFLMFSVGTVIWEENGFRTMLDTLVRSGQLELVESTPIYCPMPFSLAESHYTTRVHIYRKPG